MVPPYSQRVSRVHWYSGYSWRSWVFVYRALTLSGLLSHTIRLTLKLPCAVRTPKIFLLSVWPAPRSLATTYGISVDVFSSPYLDVSVQAVPLIYLCIQYMMTSYCDAGLLHSDICGYSVYLRLPAAFRRSLRPSSAPSAKAFPLRSL